MGSGRTQQTTSDLFSIGSAQEPSLPSTEPRTSKPGNIDGHVLPNDLPTAIKHLDDHELERLINAALVEQKRRGKKLRTMAEPPGSQRAETVEVDLTTGKLNAVRAAFKAGVKPTQIARQFGLSDKAGAGTVISHQAVSIGLIVPELVMNALKHAFPDEKQDAAIVVSY